MYTMGYAFVHSNDFCEEEKRKCGRTWMKSEKRENGEKSKAKSVKDGRFETRRKIVRPLFFVVMLRSSFVYS